MKVLLIALLTCFSTTTLCFGGLIRNKTEKIATKRRYLSDDEVDTFKVDHAIKQSANLPIQPLASSDMAATINNIEYDLSNLKPVSILADGFVVTIDGEQIDMQKMENLLWRGNVGDAEVFLAKDDTEEIAFIEFDDHGTTTSLIAAKTATSEDVLVTVTPDDYDADALSQFQLGSDSYGDVVSDVSLERFHDGGNRELSSCGSFREIEVAIAFDSSFCNYMGGKSPAVAQVLSIVGLASKKYEQLCLQLSIPFIDGYCTSNGDPYKSMTLTKSGCNGRGLLQDLKDYWRTRNNHRDAVHIFTGTSFQDGPVGCAWTKALCQKETAYGTNNMRFTKDLNLRATLFTHELGHNAGASHQGTHKGRIMNPVLNKAIDGFHSSSVASIQNYISSQTCVSDVPDNFLKNTALNPSASLGQCEGNCNSDADCDGGLVCYQRVGYNTVPGCTGLGNDNWNYCSIPPLITLELNPSTSIGLCEGDCDFDADCDVGLICHHRTDYEDVPGCSGSGERSWDYCVAPPLTDFGINPSFKLGLCEGDCDSDADCGAGLKCHFRNGLKKIPGCSGSGTAAWDYCINPSLGHVGLDPTAILGLCQGDCDSDADCAAGLKCYHRSASDEPIPGCSGLGTQAWDYCVDEALMPSNAGMKVSVDDTTCFDASWGSICLNGATWS